MDCFIARRNEILFQLLGDVLGHELRVGLGRFDLHDVDIGGAAQKRVDIALEGFNARAAAPDDHAGLSGENIDGHAVCAAFDINMADAGLIILIFEHLAKLEILGEVVRKILLIGVPTGTPVKDYANASAMGVDFLTHSAASLSFLVEHHADVTGAL